MIDIFLGAIIFAIWSVVLFYGKRIGLSMLLFAVPLTLFIVKILEKRHDDLNKKAKILILPITLLASTYFIFESFLFNALNLVVIPILIAIMILALYKEKFEIGYRCLWKIVKVLVAPLAHIGETFSNLKNSFRIRKGEKNFERSQKIKKVLKAIFITLPIVLITIILLSAADPDFAKIFEKILIAIFDFFADLSLSKIIEIIILLVVAFIYLISLFNYISL